MAEGVGSGLVWDRSAPTCPLGQGCQPFNHSHSIWLCLYGEANMCCRSVCREPSQQLYMSQKHLRIHELCCEVSSLVEGMLHPMHHYKGSVWLKTCCILCLTSQRLVQGRSSHRDQLPLHCAAGRRQNKYTGTSMLMLPV